MTEHMTQMALTAKNEELERLTTRQRKLLAGVVDVLNTLERWVVAPVLYSASRWTVSQSVVPDVVEREWEVVAAETMCR